ncbi:MAG: ABC transporter permease [Baekduia sp.]
MNGPKAIAVARRVLRQLRNDRRTVALLLLVPPALTTLLWLVLDDELVFNRVGPQLVAIFPFTTMFLVTSITMLRERTSGTLERLMTMPIARLDLVAGYAIAFGVMASLQATITATVALGLLGLDVAGAAPALVITAVVVAQLGTAIGLLVSAFARSEFQAVQFLPLTVLPQLLLCGLFVPVDELRGWLQAIARVLPLRWGVRAMEDAAAAGRGAELATDIAVLAAFIAVGVALGALTLRRRTS